MTLNEVLDAIKEAFSFLLFLFHLGSAITFIVGLLAVAGSFEETTNYIIAQWMIPSIITSILTGVLMELLETRFPSIYRILKKLLR